MWAGKTGKCSRHRELRVQRHEVEGARHRPRGLWVVSCGWHGRRAGRSTEMPDRQGHLRRASWQHNVPEARAVLS